MVDAMKLRRTWGTRHGIKCEGPARTLGLLYFLLTTSSITKRTLTHLPSISFLEVVWFEGCGLVFHGGGGLTTSFAGDFATRAAKSFSFPIHTVQVAHILKPHHRPPKENLCQRHRRFRRSCRLPMRRRRRCLKAKRRHPRKSAAARPHLRGEMWGTRHPAQ